MIAATRCRQYVRRQAGNRPCRVSDLAHIHALQEGAQGSHNKLMLVSSAMFLCLFKQNFQAELLADRPCMLVMKLQGISS